MKQPEKKNSKKRLKRPLSNPIGEWRLVRPKVKDVPWYTPYLSE